MAVNSYIDRTLVGNGEVSWSSLALADGSAFDYIATTHIGVKITKAEDSSVITVDSGDITVTTSPSLTVAISDEKYGSPAGGETIYVTQTGDVVRIYRTTPIASLTRTFSDGSVLKASDLNTQNKQALFGLQEQIDLGIGSLPFGTDNLYNAGGYGIKNLADPVDSHHAATKSYTDALAIGIDFNEPQVWTTTGGAGTDVGADWAFTLSSPTPGSTTDEMFLVEVGGVLQSPSDYNVTVDADTNIYTLTLLDQDNLTTDDPGGGAGSTVISIRNFGYTRNIAVSPFLSIQGTPAMICKRGGAGVTSSTVEIQNESGTAQSTFTHDGSLKVGTAGTDADNTEIASDRVDVGKYSATGATAGSQLKYQTEGGSSKDYGALLLSGESSAGTGKIAIDVTRGNSTNFEVLYGGNVTSAGEIQGVTVTCEEELTTDTIVASGRTQTGGLTCTSTATFIAPVTITGADFNQNSGDLTTTGTVSAAQGVTATGGNISLSGGGYLYVPGSVVQIVYTQFEGIETVALSGTALVAVEIEGLEKAIIPKSTSSKIKVDVFLNFGTADAEANHATIFGLKRDTTTLGPTHTDAHAAQPRGMANPSLGYTGLGDTKAQHYAAFTWFDEPASTSSLTYKVTAISGTTGDAENIYINRTSLDGSLDPYSERLVSSIILTEIAGP